MKLRIGDEEIKLRYVIFKKGAYYWQPKSTFRKFGFVGQPLPSEPLEMAAKAQELNRKLDDARRAGFAPVTSTYGTVAYCIQLYRESRIYKNLAPITQDNYEHRLKKFEEKWGDRQITSITRPKVVEFYETTLGKGEKRQPRKAQDYIKVLSNIIQTAIDKGLYTEPNPCLSLRMEYNEPRKFAPSDEHVEAFIAKARELGSPEMGLAVRLGYDLCQRETDVIGMKWEQFDGTHINITQSKTGQPVEIQCLPELLAALSTTKRQKTPYLVVYKHKYEKRYTPYKKDWFVHMFAWIRKEANLPAEFQFRDLRRAGLTRLAESGCSAAEMAAVSGHKIEYCEKILNVYIKKTKRLADNAIDKVVARQEADKLKAKIQTQPPESGRPPSGEV